LTLAPGEGDLACATNSVMGYLKLKTLKTALLKSVMVIDTRPVKVWGEAVECPPLDMQGNSAGLT
jgi:hypothetical protein